VKLSCLPVSYFGDIIGGKLSVGHWARQAADLGLDAVDLSVLFFKSREQAYLESMRRDVEDAGLRVAVVNTYPDLTHPDHAERDREFSQLEKDIASIGLLGAEMARVTAGQAHPETSRKEGIAWAVEGLTRAVDAAERHGVKLVFENHSKPGAWEYPDFCYPPEIFLEIAERLENTAVWILFDTANPVAYGFDPLPVLRRVIGRVRCIHAADTRTQGTFEPVLIGTGAVPFDTIFSMLKESGYDGWISIEEASRLGPAGVARAVKFVRQTWENER